MSEGPARLRPVIEYQQAAVTMCGSTKPPATEQQISAALSTARENGRHLPKNPWRSTAG